MKLRKKFTRNGLSLFTALILLISSLLMPLPTYAGGNYSATVMATNSNIGTSTILTFSTLVPGNAVVLKKVVLDIPTEYTLADNIPSDIGTFSLSAPSYGVSESWSVKNGESILAYQGNTNTYTYTITLDSAQKKITILSETGTRKTFPDDLAMTFVLSSGILTNPSQAGTFSWASEGWDYDGKSVALPGLTTSVSVSGASGGVPILPPVQPGNIVISPTPAERQAASANQEVKGNALETSTIKAQDGVTLTVPVGAVKSDTPVSIGIGNITTAPKDNLVQVLDPVKTQREFGPDGTTFPNPVTLTFPYKDLDLKGLSPLNLAVYRWDETLTDWVKLGGAIDPLRQTVSITTFHFSTYALMGDTRTGSTRLSGGDRFATANAVADEGWPNGAESVVLVNAYSFPDALAGTPLAYKHNAPILLTDSNTLSESTWNQIKKLQAKNVIILGGEGVVTKDIETFLVEQGLEVTRYGGQDRYQTGALIAKALGSTGKAVLTSGEDEHFPDALSISSWAAYNGVPILFSNEANLPGSILEVIQEKSIHEFIVAGGEGAVPQTVLDQTEKASSKPIYVSRYAGSDRYATATAIASAPDLGLNLSEVYVATGLNFADALVAGNLAAHKKAPLVLVDSTLPSATKEFFRMFARNGRILQVKDIGGEGVVSPEVDQEIQAQW